MNYMQISGWDELEQFGIKALTGESDPYCMRLLCDLNQEGVQNLAAYFGVHMPAFGQALNNNWNSPVAGQPAASAGRLQAGAD